MYVSHFATKTHLNHNNQIDYVGILADGRIRAIGTGKGYY